MDRSECQPRWQVAAGEPLLIRVTIDGGREQEEDLCTQVNAAARQYARRRACLASQLARLLDLRYTGFSNSNVQHTQELLRLWQLAMGEGTPVPPLTAPTGLSSAGPGAATGGGAKLDWGDLGFQNRYCPQSDFRDMGMLSVHLLKYYAQHHREEVTSLVQANREREQGYPFAAAAINVGHLLIKLLLEGLDPSGEAALRERSAQGISADAGTVGGDGVASNVGSGGVFRSPLFVVLSRVVEERDSGGSGDCDACVVEEVFCCAFGLLEQLWVRHGATYMMFNKVLTALKECLCVYLQDEWRQPSGSLAPLRNLDVNRVSPLLSNAPGAQPFADSRPSSMRQSTSPQRQAGAGTAPPSPAAPPSAYPASNANAGGDATGGAGARVPVATVGGGRAGEDRGEGEEGGEGRNRREGCEGDGNEITQRATPSAGQPQGSRIAHLHGNGIDATRQRHAVAALADVHGQGRGGGGGGGGDAPRSQREAAKGRAEHASSRRAFESAFAPPALAPAASSPVPGRSPASGVGSVTPRSPASPRGAAGRSMSCLSLVSQESSGSLYGPALDGGGQMHSISQYEEGSYDMEGRYDRYAASHVVDSGVVEGLEANAALADAADISSDAETPPSSVDDSDDDTHTDVVAWSPTGNMV